MFWFDRADPRCLGIDIREGMEVADTREGRRQIVIKPDQVADFRKMPFPDASFSLVVFDPPHTHCGAKSWTAKKYGKLPPTWREDFRVGFAECFRVLKPGGTLVFKWNEHRVPIRSVLALTPEQPLFGQRCGTTAKTHWIVFLKSVPSVSGSSSPSAPSAPSAVETPPLPKGACEDGGQGGVP